MLSVSISMHDTPDAALQRPHTPSNSRRTRGQSLRHTLQTPPSSPRHEASSHEFVPEAAVSTFVLHARCLPHHCRFIPLLFHGRNCSKYNVVPSMYVRRTWYVVPMQNLHTPQNMQARSKYHVQAHEAEFQLSFRSQSYGLHIFYPPSQLFPAAVWQTPEYSPNVEGHKSSRAKPRGLKSCKGTWKQ